MGLGMVSEYSRSRIPNPPQNNTTFMRVSLAPCALSENDSFRGNCGLRAVVQHLRSRTSQVASPVARGEILRVLGIAAHCSDASAIPEALFTIMGDPGRPENRSPRFLTGSWLGAEIYSRGPRSRICFESTGSLGVRTKSNAGLQPLW